MPNTTYTLRSPIPVSADEWYDWHGRPLAFQRLQPPWERTDVKSVSGEFGTDGYRVEFRARCLGPFKRTWIVDFSDFRPGTQFQYQQTRCPVAVWNHVLPVIPES